MPIAIEALRGVGGRIKGDEGILAVLQVGQYARTVPACSVLCCWANRELGISMVELARRLLLAQITVTQAVQRGEKNVAEKQLLMSVDVD
jgi:hypothetical protein